MYHHVLLMYANFLKTPAELFSKVVYCFTIPSVVRIPVGPYLEILAIQVALFEDIEMHSNHPGYLVKSDFCLCPCEVKERKVKGKGVIGHNERRATLNYTLVFLQVLGDYAREPKN